MILQQLAMVVIYILAAALVAWFGRNRKWGGWGYFFASILFTPAIGLLFVLASDPRKALPR
ncbi:MAG: hypothetical protein AAF318_13460 [Pseudomonadota bacterium]